MNAKQDSAFGHMIVLACGTRGERPACSMLRKFYNSLRTYTYSI